MSEFIEDHQDNLIDATDRIKYKNIGDFYELGNPEDWKELIKYSKFYLADQNLDRKEMIFVLLKPVLSKRFKEVGPDNFKKILEKVANLSDTEKNNLQEVIQRREKWLETEAPTFKKAA